MGNKVIPRELEDRELIRLVCNHEPPNVELPRLLSVEISRRVWEKQDGCAGENYAEWDWDGIDGSSNEAIKAMANAIREILAEGGVEELETNDRDPYEDFL